MSFPRRLRLALALDAALTSRVLAITVRAIYTWQRRQARRLRVQPGGAKAAESLVKYGSQRGVTVAIKEYP